MTEPKYDSPMFVFAILAILVGLALILASIPMFMAAYEEYKIACPEGTTKVSCQ